MEIWFIILITISISALLRALFNLFSPAAHPLPPGPPIFPVIGNIIWLKKSLLEIESTINSLHRKLGPVITLRIGSRTSIFVRDRALAHQALVENGAVFSSRPAPSSTIRIATSNQATISSSPYGPKWRLLRRNLTSEILHPSRVRSYSHARKWILQILFDRFDSQSESGDPVNVVSNFQYAMFCLLVLMCLGDKLDEKQIREIERVQRAAVVGGRRFDILNFWPSVTKILMKKRWSEFFELQKQREEVMIPLIRARKQSKEQNPQQNRDEQSILSYVDTLLNLELPDEKRKLTENEILSLCNEFLNAGTDTTSTALQWIMANLVKHPEIQDKLYNEIKDSVPQGENEVKEEQLESMPYLKAVILEGLRRHPPGHFVLPHSVTKDIILEKYLIPKTATVNFMVAEMGWDSEVWEDPMEFRPERFVGNDSKEFDITGSREIKMMPFGVGRRICPGYGLAILHLEYFVANLVWKYEWKGVGEVDLSEKQEFTIVMKNPLKARICPRF